MLNVLLVLILLLIGGCLLFLIKVISSTSGVQNETLRVLNSSLNELKKSQEATFNKLSSQGKDTEFNKVIPLHFQFCEMVMKGIDKLTYQEFRGNSAVLFILSEIKLIQTELFDKVKFTNESDFKTSQFIRQKKILTHLNVTDFIMDLAKVFESYESFLTESGIDNDQKQGLEKLFKQHTGEQTFSFVKKLIQIGGKRVKNVSDIQKAEIHIIDQSVKNSGVIKHMKSIQDFGNKFVN